MRPFRSNRENLRDTRIAYMFLLSLAIVCALLAFFVGMLSGGLHRRELEGYYETLILCADALDEWGLSENGEERYGASLRFEQAMSGLPSEVALEPLAALVNYMRMGSAAQNYVRAYSEAFALLSSIEYTSVDDARRIISLTLGSVSDAIGEDGESESREIPSNEVLRYTKTVAERSKREILDGALRTLELELSEARGTWVAETENLRVEYSLYDGRLESFLYIRVGEYPSAVLDEAERCDAALSFYNSARGKSGGTNVSALRDLGGFTLCEIEDKSGVWRVCVDTHGRVWSLFRSD